MAWFDGIFDYSEKELAEKFLVMITKNLRKSDDGNHIALINDFEENTKLYDLADPKAEEDDYGEHIFFHVFVEPDAVIAECAIKEFLSNENGNESESIMLFRKEPDRIFMYSFGYICPEMLEQLKKLRLLISELSASDKNVFILPLKRYMSKCPVCRHRTLQYRGMFYICAECGWEDEGLDDDDAKPGFGPNGDYTIREYRKKYLKLKEKNPEYTWQEQFKE